MKKGKKLKFLILAFTVLPLLAVAARTLPAAFTTPETVTHIQIDGVNYGTFDSIRGLEQFSSDGAPLDYKLGYAKVTLKRDFVTEPSLYLWAKKQRSRKFSLNNIHLVIEDEDGRVTSRKVLNLCQPLSWTVEAATPSLGGFNETVDFAVQSIQTF